MLVGPFISTHPLSRLHPNVSKQTKLLELQPGFRQGSVFETSFLGTGEKPVMARGKPSEDSLSSRRRHSSIPDITHTHSHRWATTGSEHNYPLPIIPCDSWEQQAWVGWDSTICTLLTWQECLWKIHSVVNNHRLGENLHRRAFRLLAVGIPTLPPTHPHPTLSSKPFTIEAKCSDSHYLSQEGCIILSFSCKEEYRVRKPDQPVASPFGHQGCEVLDEGQRLTAPQTQVHSNIRWWGGTVEHEQSCI